MRKFALLLVCSLWSVHALSSQLGNGLLGFALYGGASEPGAPAIQTLSQVNTGLEVTISAPQEPGGYPVIGYQYSLDGFTWLDASAGATIFVVPTDQLTLGATNVVYLRSVSAAGTSESNATASVYVELPTFTVSPNTGAGGAINPATAQTIAQGATTTFTVTPDEGYTAAVAGSCGGSLSGNTYTTNAVTAACTVEASFKLEAEAVPIPAMPLPLLLLLALLLIYSPKKKRLL